MAAVSPADTSFLRTFYERSADRTGAVLIFDEIVTSRNGARRVAAAPRHHARYDDFRQVFPGAGFSSGAFGGRADIMNAAGSCRRRGH